MIRLSELKLPLDHAPQDLGHLVRKTLGVAAADIVRIDVFKRSVDARKVNLLRVYVVDVALGSDALLVVHRGAIVHALGDIARPMNL